MRFELDRRKLEIDQVAHFDFKGVRYSDELLEPDFDPALLYTGNVGMGVGLADHACKLTLRDALRLSFLTDRFSEPLVLAVFRFAHVFQGYALDCSLWAHVNDHRRIVFDLFG